MTPHPGPHHPRTGGAAGHVLVVGEALVDVVPGADGPQDLPGGSPANVAVTMARLGQQVVLATSLGNDARGTLVRRWLEDDGVQVHAAVPASGRTSSAVVSLAADGSATYDFDLSWDLGDLDIAGAAVLHVGSIGCVLTPGADVVRDAVRRARAQAIVSLDPNVRPALTPDRAAALRQVEELVALADIVKASDEDLAWLHPGEDHRDVARRWATWGPGLVVVTCGAAGATLVRSDGTVLDVPGRSVPVVDTVGAGDTFTGALLDTLAGMGVRGQAGRARLRHLSDAALRRAAGVAATAASVTVSRAGANPPSRGELAAALGPVRPKPFDGAPVRA